MDNSSAFPKTVAMGQVAREIIDCNRCGLAKNCTNKVIGIGNIDSNLVLIGEAPGKKEDEMGLPFVGSAGKLLDKLLSESNLLRKEIFISNILKCRPDRNRRPRKSEVEECESHLIQQLRIIKPRLIAPMGNIATTYFLNKYGIKKDDIGKLHGKTFLINTDWGMVTLVPLYHPAAAIYNRDLFTIMVEDMKKITLMV
jgi:DNA polymerase